MPDERIAVPPNRVFGEFFLNVLVGGGEGDADLVFAVLQHRRYIKFIGAVHVFGRADKLTVKVNRSEGIKPLTAQKDAHARLRLLEGEAP